MTGETPNEPQDGRRVRSAKIAWGRAENNVLVYIEDTEYGQGCALYCPQCGYPLIAKNRCRKVSNHFAHAVSVECTGESAIHQAAKQVLVRAAFGGAYLKMPEATGVEMAADLLEQPHSAPWKVERRRYAMSTGSEEQSIGKELRVDVLVWGERESRDVAVEMCVTHRKAADDVEKFISLRQDAIEIDLSEVPWNADAEALEEAVLGSAPRQWLFGGSLEEAAAQAKAEANRLAQSRNAKLHEHLNFFVNGYVASRADEWPLKWPEIKGVAKERDAFGNDLYSSSVRTPRVSDRITEWVRESWGWRCTARVNGKTQVEVIVGVKDAFQPSIRPDAPTLSILIAPPSDGIFCSEARLKWHNVEKWREKLKWFAAEGLKPRLARSARGKEKADELLARFRAANDTERLPIACELANAPVPARIGRVDHAWGVPYTIWKTLVWHYKIQRRLGHEILPAQIAEDRWLCQLMGLPAAEEGAPSVELPERSVQRSKRLWFWLRALEQHGIVSHEGRQYFSVLRAPEDFMPWAYLKV